MEAIRNGFATPHATDPIRVLDAILNLGLPSNDAVVAAIKLWEFVGRRPGRAVITPSQLAGYARTEHARSARRWIEYYVDAGLVEIIERDKRRGSYEVQVFDPLEVARARAVRHLADDQIELDFEPGEPSAIAIRADMKAPLCPPDGQHADMKALLCPPDGHESASVSAQLGREKLSEASASAEFVRKIEQNRRRIAAEKTSDRHGACFARENLNLNLTSLQPNTNSNLKPNSSAPAARAAPGLERFEVSKILEGLGKVSDPEWIAAQNDRLIGWLESAFPGLQRAVSRRIAEAVTAGRIPEAKFRDAADGATSEAKNPRAYFIGAAQNIFRQHCVPWHETISPG